MINQVRNMLAHPIGAKRPISTLARVAAWQARSRLARGRAVRFGWIDGATLLARRGDHGLTGNIYYGLSDFPEMALLLHLLRPGDLFVDVGANLGAYTILAAAVAGADVLALEPHPANYARLLENVECNRVGGKVEAIMAAAGDTPGRLMFTGSGTTCHLVGPAEAAPDAIEVPVLTLDGALRGRGPTMIKIDVEGFEAAVLTGSALALRSPRLRVVVAELMGAGGRYGADEAKMAAGLAALGFDASGYDPAMRAFSPPSGQSGNNKIFVRGAADLLPLLASAPRRNLHGVDF